MQQIQPNINDQVQRHSASQQPHTHTHNGRPCSGHHGHQNHPQHQPNNSIYFKMLKDSFQTKKVFFWNEVLEGGVIDELIKRYSVLSIFKHCRNNYLQKFASTVLGFATQFLPNILKPFFAGFFLPLLVFLYVNWKLLSLRIFPNEGETSWISSFIGPLYITIMSLFFMVAVIGPGNLASQENKQKTQKLLSQKPYLNNARVLCAQCQIIKGFRSQHCPSCKQCIPKFSKHSPIFNRCIGASNQLIYLLFNMSIVIAQLLTLYMFLIYSPSDMVFGTKVTVFIINYYVLWIALVQTLKMFILNMWYNLTEHEVRNWMYLPYLIAFGKRQFFNPLDIGLMNNIKESVYALTGLQQSQEGTNVIIGSLVQTQETNKKFINNWAKSLYSSGSELINHPHRREIAMKTKQMQNLIQMQTQIMNKVRQQVLSELKGKRPIHQINQIIMMQTQMQLQREMQKTMMQKMQNPQQQVKKQAKQYQEPKGDQNQRLIQDSHKEESSVELKFPNDQMQS